MLKNVFASLITGAVVFAAAPAGATNWNENIDLCKAAVDAQGLAVISDYSVKFAGASGGATKNLALKLIPNDGGDKLIAECKIRRGEVTEVTVSA